MEIQALKIFNSIKLILFLNLILGVITVLTACGDLVKESDANACNSAIDARDYKTAKSICTDRKDIASAYMGLAGYDIINLLKSSGSSTKKYDDDNVSGDGLKKDDVSGLSILNLLRLSVDDIADNDTRTTKIKASKSYLDSASALLHPCISDNCTPPITTDEILLDTFALSFAMQLNQLIIYDNATTSTDKFPDNATGSLVCDEATARTASELRRMDGHLWTAERDGIQCNRMKSAIEALPTDNETAVLIELATWETGEKLPDAIYETVCEPILSLTEYLDNLTESTIKLATLSGDNTTLSGDNTKAITDAQTSTDNLTKTVGCVE
jgi:hypothetical protein